MGGGCQNIVLLKKREREGHKGNELKSKKGQNEIENSKETEARAVVGRVTVPGTAVSRAGVRPANTASDKNE